MRLKGDVTEVLEREQRQILCVTQYRRDRQWNLSQQSRDIHEGEAVHLKRGRVQGENERRTVPADDPEVAPVGRIPGQGKRPHPCSSEADSIEIGGDPFGKRSGR